MRIYARTTVFNRVSLGKAELLNASFINLAPFFHSRFDMDTPIYVNLVRDPVERVISWYYYVRAPWYFVERKRAFPELPLPNPNWLRKVSSGLVEKSYLSVLHFLCLNSFVSTTLKALKFTPSFSRENTFLCC